MIGTSADMSNQQKKKKEQQNNTIPLYLLFHDMTHVFDFGFRDRDKDNRRK